MNPNTTVRCAVCGEDIHNGQPCIGSKPKGEKPIFIHYKCYKPRKERKA